VWLEKTNQTYIYYLFLTRYPSNLLPTTGRQENAFQDVFSSVGQVHFGTPDALQSAESLPAGCEGVPSQTFFITRKAQIEPGWQQVIAVRNRAGVPIWQALVKT
ncbi:MAG TPA: hypothetical protein VHV10_05845, partial [Ktedonobacteraceae bacterium]|nr:hypothetical protein [Ktedonobacteraceae bacterium]